jgi:hypothetical protein
VSRALHLFRAPAGRDTLEWARSHYRGDQEDEAEAPGFTAEERASIARSLTEQDPRLKAEAEEDGTWWVYAEAEGVDYEVLDDSVLVSLTPFAGRGALEDVVRDTLRVAAAVAGRHGLSVYDPTDDRLVEPAGDVEGLVAAYRRGLEAAHATRRVRGSLPFVVLLTLAALLAARLWFRDYQGVVSLAGVLVLTAWMVLSLRRPR